MFSLLSSPEKPALPERVRENIRRQEDATERPFANKYWNHKGDGTYYDVISGEPLFDSGTKFKSGSGDGAKQPSVAN